MQQQAAVVQQEYAQSLARANELSAENERLNQLLAQSQQQAQLYEENVSALREQLRSSASQVARLKEQTESQQREFDLLQASTRRRGGATITPNSSVAAALPAVNLEGVSISQEGSEIRLTVNADRLFAPGDSRLSAQSATTISGLARILEDNYAGRRVRIEGHLDRDPAANRSAVMEQQITSSQALAVLDALLRAGRFTADQFSVAGQGGGTPLFSNSSDAGRARNRRVELVILPDAAADR